MLNFIKAVEFVFTLLALALFLIVTSEGELFPIVNLVGLVGFGATACFLVLLRKDVEHLQRKHKEKGPY